MPESKHTYSVEDYVNLNNKLYYAKHNRLGSGGDFITAPEISPLFGYTLASWIAQQYRQLASSSNVLYLLELGPGRGYLIKDLCHALKGLLPRVNVVVLLLEQSEHLQSVQRQRLQMPVTFIKDVKAFADYSAAAMQSQRTSGPFFCVANEFFDAWGARQLRWHLEKDTIVVEERFISLNEMALTKVVKKCKNPLHTFQLKRYPQNVWIEWQEQALSFWSNLLKSFASLTGGILMIDYGEWQGYGDTLQAITAQQHASLPAVLGQVDLSHQLRFSDYAVVAQKHLPSWQAFYTTQAQFLKENGFLNWLSAFQSKNQSLNASAHKTLTSLIDNRHQTSMGQLFKVLALTYTP